MWGILIGLFCVAGGMYFSHMFQLGAVGFVAAIVIGVGLAIKAS